jgi:fructan beta-fructosidase
MNTHYLRAVVLLVLESFAGICVAADRPDIVIADFEGSDYGEWKVAGEAFGKAPARGTLPGQMHVEGYEGQGLVNSFTGGDRPTGTLTSPVFKVRKSNISFLIGGGYHPEKTCINLLVDGKIVRTATGPNSQPGGSERLEWQTWDVSRFQEQSAVIQIVDTATGGWGHINVDQIVQSDGQRGAVHTSSTINVYNRYLHLPVKNKAPMRRMKLAIDGRTVREFDIELADNKPDFFAFVDLAAFRGKRLTFETVIAAGSLTSSLIATSDELPDAASLYREPIRPQFHFTSRRGWLNDPNGLVYYEGRWHLFYQHNPYGWSWGNMHWGHATSRDLFRWQEQPIALYPPKYGDWCFSGSAIVDKQNTSGWKKGDRDVLVAAFSSTGRGECIVYSNDGGQTWTEHEGNPVVRHKGRDPRLLWHEPTTSWVIAVYTEDGGGQAIAFYTSKNLKEWTYASRIEGFFECPDLVELPVDGDPTKTRWVLYAADGKYLIGDFDGRKFTKESGKHTLWQGNFYAAQTFSNAPEGRCIQIGWARGAEFPGMPFNQQMNVPVELTLRTTEEGPRLFAVPVEELVGLYGRSHRLGSIALEADSKNPLAGVRAELIELIGRFEPGDAREFGFMLRGTKVTYDVKKQSLTVGNVTAPLALRDGRVKLQILVDRGSIEVFGNSGRVAIAAHALAKEDNREFALWTRGAKINVPLLVVNELTGTWTNGK